MKQSSGDCCLGIEERNINMKLMTDIIISMNGVSDNIKMYLKVKCSAS